MRLPLLVLLGAVACVLLIACANVANLLLARGAGRTREMAIRAAIGAGPGRILRQLLTESVLLSLVGGAIGLLLAAAGVRALLVLSAAGIPRIGLNGAAIAPDARVLDFTLLLSVLTGVGFGLVPALHASHVDLRGALKEGGSRSGSRHNRTRGIIIVAEMALACVLLTGAGLLLQTFIALQQLNPGFDAGHVLTMETALDGDRFDHTAAIVSAVHLCEERITAIPGVQAVAIAPSVPLESSISHRFLIAGRTEGDLMNHGLAWWRPVTWRYFDVYKIPILRGRGFSSRDDAGAPPVVLIDETMARKFWPSANPIGQHIQLFESRNLQEPYCEIVGVVGDIGEYGLQREHEAATYVPLPQISDEAMAFVRTVGPFFWAIRTSVDPYSISAAVQHEIQSAAGLSVGRVRSMGRVVSAASARDRFNAVLLAIFAVVAVALASIGLHGVISYSIEQRAQEFAIRLTLGATPSLLRNRIVQQAMAWAVAGLVIGLAAALALTRLIASILYGVNATDALVFVSVAFLMLLVAVLASLIPARRASRIDPMAALRSE